MTESQYQRYLIRKISEMFPECMVILIDPKQVQGIPDLLILYGKQWAMLEVKTSLKSVVQPNQIYYVDMLDLMSFASFISPEVERDVLNELQQAFGVVR
jgi:hypothetical protein